MTTAPDLLVLHDIGSSGGAEWADAFADWPARVLAPDLPALAPEVVAAITGATAEALTNAAKHGGAGRATVFVDLDDDEATVCCSIKDAGTGFDPAAHVDGVGLTRSVRGRLADVGGTVEVEGRPGRGTEVRLHAPVAGRTLLPDAGGR